jgi:hypothetical protein
MPFAWGLYQFAADEHDDVWAIGNHHSFGNPPAHFARFANHDHGAI